MAEKYANAFWTHLTAPMLVGDLTAHVALAAPAALQGGQFRVSIGTELLLVTAGAATTTWTVARAIEGTTAAAHRNGLTVAHVLTAALPAEVINARGGYATLAEKVRGGVFDVRDYGYVDVTGATESTTAVRAAFAAAFTAGGEVVLPPGVVLTDTIDYKGQSIRGAGMPLSYLRGKPGKDVLNFAYTGLSAVITGMHWRDFTITVDDSTDASASFPERGGVGNCGFASDLADGSTIPSVLLNADVSNVQFEGLSGTARNASCGIFQQSLGFHTPRFRNVKFYRLAYGFWDSYPTSNLASADIYRDDYHCDSLHFNGCTRAWRMVNQGNGQITNLTMHENTYGLELRGVQTAGRNYCGSMAFQTVYIENSTVSLVTDASTWACVFDNLAIGSGAGETVIELGFRHSIVRGAVLSPHNAAGDPVLRLTGNHNHLSGLVINGNGTAPFQWDQIDDQGIGNIVEILGYYGSEGPNIGAPMSGTSDNRVLYSRDPLPGILGHVDPMPVGAGDLLISPANIRPLPGYAEGTDWEFRQDAAADFGSCFRRIVAGGLTQFAFPKTGVVGQSLPKARCRVYIKAKAGTGGPQTIWMGLNGAFTWGWTPTWTTSYTITSQDIDLTAASAGDVLGIVFTNIDGGGAGPIDIAWIMVRPFFHDVLSDGNVEVGAVSGGIIFKSPDGTRYIAKIANGGTWTIGAA